MMDTVWKILKYLEDELTMAWLKGGCQTCPLGELAALAAATRTFYELHTRSKPGSEAPKACDTTTPTHWSHEWWRKHGV